MTKTTKIKIIAERWMVVMKDGLINVPTLDDAQEDIVWLFKNIPQLKSVWGNRK